MPVPQFSKLFNSDVHRHVMLDQPAKCYPNQTILCSIVSMSCRFSRRWPLWRNFASAFILRDVTFFRRSMSSTPHF